MSLENRSKLNNLQRDLPEGMLASSFSLNKKSYSNQLLKKYRESGWLESPARGVYRRPGPPLKWQQVVASLCRLLDSTPHVGGLSALELRGYAHFLKPQGPGEIHLYSDTKLPGWVAKLPLRERLVAHRNRLFVPSHAEVETIARENAAVYLVHTASVPDDSLTHEVWGPWDWHLPYSTPERAMLELLAEVPQRESVEHAALLMQGLADLSSRRVLALLAACNSVKVKRLFLALASRHRHQWVARVVEAADRGEVDIGKGKRSLAPGGKLHPKYLITLPEESDVRG